MLFMIVYATCLEALCLIYPPCALGVESLHVQEPAFPGPRSLPLSVPFWEPQLLPTVCLPHALQESQGQTL